MILIALDSTFSRLQNEYMVW